MHHKTLPKKVTNVCQQIVSNEDAELNLTNLKCTKLNFETDITESMITSVQ